MKRNIRRQNSNIFEAIHQAQIQELREAFNLIDVDRNSLITRTDLVTFLSGMGNPFTPAEIDEMLSIEPLNFMQFLTMIGEKLSLLDDEKVILRAFKEFDEGNGKCNEKVLKEYLTTHGDCMTEEDVDYLMKDCVDNGEVDYKKLASIIRYGEAIDKL